MTETIDQLNLTVGIERKMTRIIATGGVLGALGASLCCVVPLVLFSLGISGAWIGNLTAMAPYKPIFVTVTFGFLGYGYWLVYRKPICAEGEVCAQPQPNRLVKTALWGSTILVLIATFWTWIAPAVAPVLLGL